MSKPPRNRATLRTLAAVSSVLLLAACSATAPAAEKTPGSGVLQVVASTSVYADVAQEIGGSAVEVRALVEQTSQDPHSYEATARDKLAVSKAEVIIANGGGYDPFMDALAGGLDLPDDAITRAVDFQQEHGAEGESAAQDRAETSEHSESEHSGHDHSAGNEHVWYDVHTVGALAAGLAMEYSELRPEHTEQFAAAAAAFQKRIDELSQKIVNLQGVARGKKFAMTEPLPFHLLTDAGMQDGTPEGISEAMEAGEDVPPLLLKKLSEGLAAGDYSVLAVNTQTTGPQSRKVAELARQAGVPVLEMTETLPEGQNYFSWMESNVQQLEVALGR
ncbi:ABC transporter substrate-binding protein [Paeniglutamicibacter gangotriensis]|uniref:ABC transporter substrate-binding protein n=1 Tax=Paeniglutamicibacter gangotriensis TaxID=254787 RepID=A0A5B0ELX7_9MICC|nr:zinc ABC transporter substrate-binding protein [Paeniglutamicibacter gangotriensis]KAA0978750.1 ABC transporter substrate-binding protein [Paeniglutamicibacter gangotriensis]